MSTNRRNRAVPATLTFSQRQSIQVLGLALRDLFKGYLREPPPEQFLPLIAKLNEIDRRSLSANDAACVKTRTGPISANYLYNINPIRREDA
jgi:hypothetical protein